MIGIVIVTHSNLGKALLNTLASMNGRRPQAMCAVSIDAREKDAAKLREKIASAIKTVNQSSGVLILTDMFGGTPSNLSYSFLEEGHIEVLSGVNLPALIYADNSRKNKILNELAQEVEACGKKSISLASEILKGNKRSQL
ncbi:PTS fructose transporter subunit IIA [Candidatus Magnetomoraceae bacterium gMMP-15]